MKKSTSEKLLIEIRNKLIDMEPLSSIYDYLKNTHRMSYRNAQTYINIAYKDIKSYHETDPSIKKIQNETFVISMIRKNLAQSSNPELPPQQQREYEKLAIQWYDKYIKINPELTTLKEAEQEQLINISYSVATNEEG